MASTRCASYWDQENLYAHELRIDGECVVHSTYHSTPAEVWKRFIAGPKDGSWNRDLTHDLYLILEASPDAQSVIYGYGPPWSGPVESERWGIDIWPVTGRHPIRFERKIHFDYPSEVRSVPIRL